MLIHNDINVMLLKLITIMLLKLIYILLLKPINSMLLKLDRYSLKGGSMNEHVQFGVIFTFTYFYYIMIRFYFHV